MSSRRVVGSACCLPTHPSFSPLAGNFGGVGPFFLVKCHEAPPLLVFFFFWNFWLSLISGYGTPSSSGKASLLHWGIKEPHCAY